MIESIFSHIKDNIEGGKIKDLHKLLKEVGAFTRFKDVFSDYGGTDGDKVCTYLLFCYCVDSSFVVAGADWHDTKVSILELCGLEVYTHEDVLFFRKQSIKDAINFLCGESSDWRYRQLVVWKEAAALLDAVAVSPPNIQQKSPSKNIRDAAIYSNELKEKAAALEKTLLQQSKSPARLKESQSISLDNMSFEKLLKQAQESKG